MIEIEDEIIETLLESYKYDKNILINCLTFLKDVIDGNNIKCNLLYRCNEELDRLYRCKIERAYFFMIKSISYDQSEIIKNILALHVSSHKIDCDCTYSIGNFYKNTGIDAPKYKFDLYPQIDGVVKADSRALPLQDDSIDCMMFDPPHSLQRQVRACRMRVGTL